MGEQKNQWLTTNSAAQTTQTVETLGGRMQVRWDGGGAATPHGQLAFFAEYLAVTGVFEEWVKECPLAYESSNAPEAKDVLGTLVVSLLAGHHRYSHVTGLRKDSVAAEMLGLRKLCSSDSVRRGLHKIDEASGAAWMQATLLRSVTPALERPWIMDMDVTVKPLYGAQEGAVRSYNPHKPGRPSHALHTYWMSNLRMVIDVDTQRGNAHTSAHGRDGLCRILDGFTPSQKPYLVRGDCGYGNEGMMAVCETREQGYLFRLRQTTRVKQLLHRAFVRRDWHQATSFSCGYEALEDTLQLDGWTRARRVVVLRRRLRDDIAVTQSLPDGSLQLSLAIPTTEVVSDGLTAWEFTVLVTNTPQDLQAIGQLYRDRCDCENGFDELKNQWGWGGFTTHALTANRHMARITALVYNWWSWYVRAANPKARLEAATSRPLLLAAIGRMVRHAGQTTLFLTTMHAESGLAKSMIANVSMALAHVRTTAKQLLSADRWAIFVGYVCRQILGPPPKFLALSP
jgi:Transposase DDE domain group 1